MDALALTLVLATVFLWGVFSAKAQSAWLLSTPIVFVSSGFILTEVSVLDLHPDHETVKTIAEVTLVWVLFSDAAAVDPHKLRADLSMYLRLLGIGLPLTVGLGALLAMTLLGLNFWAALLVGAALAPTDAALGAAVMTNPRVSSHIRRVLNVESGLNDGVVTPVVLLAIAGVATDLGIEGVHAPSRAALSLLMGLLVGVTLGAMGGLLTCTARRRGWLAEGVAGPAVLALALMSYTCAVLVDGNGFVAAFVGGIAFGSTAGARREHEISYVEETAGLSSMIAWLVFGAVVLPDIGSWLDWRLLLYALLSLTLIRMVPVFLSLQGTGTSARDAAFIGWFGPRGLASIIFALLALESLKGEAHELVSVIGLTVLFSVVAHGLSAGPLASRLGTAKSAMPAGTIEG